MSGSRSKRSLRESSKGWRSVSGGCARLKTRREQHHDKGTVLLLDGDQEMLCIRFPLLRLHFTVADFVSLADGALLNDTVIDFYLNHIVAHLLPDHITAHIVVLPSLLWHRLTASANPLERFAGDATDPQAFLSQEIRTYVDFWVEQVDLFTTDLVVIPVIEQHHWMLAVLSHPSMLLTAEHNHPSSVTVFDSQRSDDDSLNSHVFNTILRLLQHMHGRRHNQHPPLHSDRLTLVVPSNLPQQTNNIDCGLFILEYARCFLRRQPTANKEGSFDFLATYPEFSVSSRNAVQREILSLCVEPQLWTHLTQTSQVSPQELPSSLLATVNDVCSRAC